MLPCRLRCLYPRRRCGPGRPSKTWHGLLLVVIGILIGVELVLNSANVNLIAFDRYLGPGRIDGQITALFIIVLAAAEATRRVALGW